MGIKKKTKQCDKIFFLLHSCVLEEVKGVITETNNQILKIFIQVIDSSDGLEQMSLLKQVGNLLQKVQPPASAHECMGIDILGYMYFQITVKSPLKRATSSILQTISEHHYHIVIDSLTKALKGIIQIPSSTISLKVMKNSVGELLALSDNFPVGANAIAKNFIDVCDFLSFILNALSDKFREELSPQETTDMYSVCQSSLKVITSSFQQCDNEITAVFKTSSQKSKLDSSFSSILGCIVRLLKDDSSLLNCKINAAIAFPLLLQFVDGNLMEYLSSKQMQNSFPIKEKVEDFPITSQLCIWSGIMATVSSKELINTGSEGSLAERILDEMLKLSKRGEDSAMILSCSRALLQWTVLMRQILNSEECPPNIRHKFSGSGDIIQRLLQYVWTNWEHFIDGVRHHTREVFKNTVFMHLHSDLTDPMKKNFLKELSSNLLEMPWHCRGKYGILCCLVEYLGSETIIQLRPTLPTDLCEALVESSLACHVSELYEALCKNHDGEYDNSIQEETWMIPLIDTMCYGTKEQRIAINEHVLPKILRLNPQGVHYLINQLLSLKTRKAGNWFGALITCAKIAQKQEIHQKEIFQKKGSLQKEILEAALCHADDHIRISAFGLLCDTPKTTEPISSSEFHLVKVCLPWNISSQCPSFRQQFIAFMKKFLFRVRESGYALQKKKLKDRKEISSEESDQLEKYQAFLIWIRDYIYSCLHPGANFPRRVTALHLLSLFHSMITNQISDHVVYLKAIEMPSHAETLLELLKDTYENNKQLVLEMLTSNSSCFSYFQDPKRLRELLDISLILASSTKPPDSVTASYILALMVHFNPTLKIAIQLSKEIQSDMKLFSLPSTNDKQATTFVILLILISQLHSQLKMAQKNLLEAAACGPMYGILTCIRSILKEANLSSILDSDYNLQWRLLLSDLISLCFKVTAAVEPVVCNSSPEGHLPMDTNPESILLLQTTVQNAIGNRFHSAVVNVNEKHKTCISSSDTEKAAEKISQILPSTVITVDLVKTRAVTAQMLLLCSWRTHREVSLLLGDICEKVTIIDPESGNSQGLLSVNQIVEIGHFFTLQLCEVKHRGAFEQAYVGFCKLCHRLWRSTLSDLHQLPQKWLQQLLAVVSGKTDTIQLCPTRRSGGVPFIVQALLVSEPDVMGSSCFKQALTTLLEIAQPISQKYSLDSQVHALNILRALYKDTCLGESVMSFVSDGLRVAILGFKGLSWATRNSATLLFSALMTRVFGVKRSRDEMQRKNCMTGRVFFSRFPDLFDFLLNELETSAKALQHQEKCKKVLLQPSLYPVLLLLSRLYPSVVEGSDSSLKLTAFIPHIRYCAGSSVWKIRLLAARALVPMLSPEEFPSTLEQLFRSLPTFLQNVYHNKVHGILLQILNIIREIPSLSATQKSQIMQKLPTLLNDHIWLALRCNLCYITRAAFMEIIYCATCNSIELDIQCIKKILDDLQQELTLVSSDLGREQFLVLSVLVSFLLVLQFSSDGVQLLFSASDKTNSLLPSDSFLSFIIHLLASPVYEIRIVTLHFLRWLLDDNLKSVFIDISSTYDFVLMKKTIDWEAHAMKEVKMYLKALLLESCRISEFLVTMIAISETHPGCLAELYKVLYFLPKTVTCSWTNGPLTIALNVAKKLDWILLAMNSCNNDDVGNSMLIFSANLAAELYEYLFKNHLDDPCIQTLEKWTSVIETNSLPEQSIARRCAVISVMRNISCTILLDCHLILGNATTALWQALLHLLMDDESEIKQQAGEVVLLLSTQFHKDVTNDSLPVVPTLALDLMIGQFVRKFSQSHPSSCLAALLDWMLQCDTTDQEVQGDEQPFDKGEMNVFAEDLTLTKLTQRHLIGFLKLQTDVSKLRFLDYQVSCWKTYRFGPRRLLDINDTILLCLQEANDLGNDFASYSIQTPFLNRNFDRNNVKLFQRLQVVCSLLPWTSGNILTYVKEQVTHVVGKLRLFGYLNKFLFDLAVEMEQCCDVVNVNNIQDCR